MRSRRSRIWIPSVWATMTLKSAKITGIIFKRWLRWNRFIRSINAAQMYFLQQFALFFQCIFLQILMSVRQKRPTVLTAAITLWALTSVFATLPMSWDLMESSVTVSLNPHACILLHEWIAAPLISVYIYKTCLVINTRRLFYCVLKELRWKLWTAVRTTTVDVRITASIQPVDLCAPVTMVTR